MKLSPLRLRAVVVLILTAIAGATPALAHHSFAMFDKNTRQSIQGTVARFEWTNPHVFIIVDVPDENGGNKRYSIECSSVNMLARAGWKPHALKAGERIAVEFYPLKNGQAGGLLEAVTRADGRVLKG